jgi:hypothetical protein
MARRPVFNGPFDMMDFPEYAFREYPKEISLANGTRVIAETQKHELELRTEDTTVAEVHPAELEAAALAKANDMAQGKIAELEAQLAKLTAKTGSGPDPLAALTKGAK